MINILDSYEEDEYTQYIKDNYDFDGKGKVEVKIPSINIDFLKKKTDWNIFLILGRSGVGKSIILNEIKNNVNYTKQFKYNESKPIISQFKKLKPNEVCELFNGIGLSSVPTWLHKPSNLSNGEKFRLEIASNIAFNSDDEFIIIDEFTSVVNRDVAKSMSYSINKLIRKLRKKIILASCHYDIIEWLNPDYILDLNKSCQGICEIEHINYKNYIPINVGDTLSDERNIP